MTTMLLGLDYELFFGKNTGSEKKCLIEPTQRLTDALSRCQTAHSPKITLFVDACYLLRLQELENSHPVLGKQRAKIQKQLNHLSQMGHNIQLHIHPHWMDCHYSDDGWSIDTTRYRLHDFSADEQKHIVKECKRLLEDVSEQPVFAYRAGGWCVQPFDQIADALAESGIWLDSTVYQNGVSEDPTRWFNFTNAPQQPSWHFDTDPLVPEQGRFVEVPISHQRISPLFFWKMAAMKKLTSATTRPFGDGSAMVAHANYYLERLTRSSHGPVSIDGIKGDLLEDAYRQHMKYNPNGYFNVMGHPKAMTLRSISKLTQFLERHQDVQLVGFEDLAYLSPLAQGQSDEAPLDGAADQPATRYA